MNSDQYSGAELSGDGGELRHYCCFEVAGAQFALDASDVREVMRYRAHTHVAGAPSFIHGLMNLRGEIVTTVDLRRRLGHLDSIGAERSEDSLVVLHTDVPVSLLVDRVHDIVLQAPAALHPLPPTTRRHLCALARGVFEIGEDLVVLLDANSLLEHPSTVNP